MNRIESKSKSNQSISVSNEIRRNHTLTTRPARDDHPRRRRSSHVRAVDDQ
jgi:hypothetical protein